METLFRNTFISKRPGVSSFADIIKITIMLIKEILMKGLMKVKRITKTLFKHNFYLYILI